MNVDLQPIKAKLAACTIAELNAVIQATHKVPQSAPNLLAWADAASRWELDRRHDFDYLLRPPKIALSDMDMAASVDAVMTLRYAFSQNGSAKAIFGVLDELERLLTARTPRKQPH